MYYMQCKCQFDPNKHRELGENEQERPIWHLVLRTSFLYSKGRCQLKKTYVPFKVWRCLLSSAEIQHETLVIFVFNGLGIHLSSWMSKFWVRESFVIDIKRTIYYYGMSVSPINVSRFLCFSGFSTTLYGGYHYQIIMLQHPEYNHVFGQCDVKSIIASLFYYLSFQRNRCLCHTKTAI